MPNLPRERVPENAPGDFYVEANQCIRCCLPHDAAPDLMNDARVEFRECYFRRQPQTEAEVEQAIRTFLVSETGAQRYGGTDAAILRRLMEAGCGDCCDHSL